MKKIAQHKTIYLRLKNLVLVFQYLQIMWLRNTPSSRLVVEFSLYKCRIPLVTSTNGFPETKLILSVFPATLPSKGVESLVDLLEEVTEELMFK